MTKAEIVNEVAKSTGLEKTTVQTVVEAFMETVKASLVREEPVYLRGFGSFIIKHRAEKAARNITKNTTMTIPAHNIPAFKPAKVFKLCQAVKREKDIRWQRTSVKSACARTDIRRSNFSVSAILAVC